MGRKVERELTPQELKRLHAQYVARDVPLAELAASYGFTFGWIASIARREGWGPRGRVDGNKVVKVKPITGWRMGVKPACTWHDPDDLCGGRRLAGREFLKRKAELEKREAEAAARK